MLLTFICEMYLGVFTISPQQKAYADIKSLLLFFVVEIHWSAKAEPYASRYKRFGNLCYVNCAVQVSWGTKTRILRVKVNEGEWEEYCQVTALCIGNGKCFGGAMKITPNADPAVGIFRLNGLPQNSSLANSYLFGIVDYFTGLFECSTCLPHRLGFFRTSSEYVRLKWRLFQAAATFLFSPMGSI